MKKLLSLFISLQLFLVSTSPALADFASDIEYSFSPTVQAYERVCGEDSIPGSELITDSVLSQMCEVVGASDLCKGVEDDEKRDCKNPENNEASLGGGILSCIEGLFESVVDLWNMVKGLLKFIYDSATSSKKRAEISEEAGAFLDSIALYFETEMIKAKEDMRGWFKDVRAGVIVAKKLFGKFVGMIQNVINESFSKYACYNQEGQSRITCKLIGNIFLPPVAFFGLLKKGPAAFKKAVSMFAKKDPKLSGSSGTRPMPSKTVKQERGSTVPAQRKGPMDMDTPASSRTNIKDTQVRNYKPADSQLMTSTLMPLKGYPPSPKASMIKEALNGKPGQDYGLKKLGGGITDTYIIELPDGTRGVFKPRDVKSPEAWASNYRAEVLAHQIDHKLGLGLVPGTIEVSLQGRMKGSFQLFVPNAKTGSATKVKPKQSDLNKQSFFDYLIDNGDRHSGNYMVKNDGSIVSIDHGLSFTNKGNNRLSFEQRKPSIIAFFKTPEGQKAVAKLKDIRDNSMGSFEREIANYLGKHDAQRMSNRIYDLIDLSEQVTP